jgi:flagellar biosynthesis protein FliR
MTSAAVFQWSIFQFQSFTLVLMRVSPIIFLLPIFSGRQVPNLAKAGLTLTVSLILLPTVKIDLRHFPGESYEFIYFIAAELMVGFILGLAVKLIFAGVQLAGELVAYQMGLAMANIIDPQSEGNSTLIAEFSYLIALLIFLLVDGHHWFFRALVQSFAVIAPGGVHLQGGLLQYFSRLSGEMFTIAVKLSAPVMAVLIFTQIALGLVAKMVPQINILLTSFPLTIGLGLFFFGLSFDLFGPYLKNLLEQAGVELVRTLLPLLR